jgi:hypothetical protein
LVEGKILITLWGEARKKKSGQWCHRPKGRRFILRTMISSRRRARFTTDTGGGFNSVLLFAFKP